MLSEPAPSRFISLPLLRHLLRYRALLPVSIFSLGVLCSLFVWQSAQSLLRARQQAAFESRVTLLAQQIEAHMQASAQVLRGVAGLFMSSESVSGDEFRIYVATLRMGDRYPGIQGIGFSQFIQPGDLAVDEDLRDTKGMRNHRVWPAGSRDMYSSIILLEPQDWRNQRALGFDMLSEPVRRAAMLRARDTAQAALSGRVRLVQETDEDLQAGSLLYVPVYRRATENAEIEQRRADLLGWAYAPLRVKDFLHGVLAGDSALLLEQMAIDLQDGERTDADNVLFRSENWKHAEGGLFEISLALRMAGQSWVLKARSLPDFEAHMSGFQGRGFLVAGTFASVLLAFLISFILNSYDRTAGALAETAEAHRLLSQSQAELQSIFDTSGVGMLQLDIRGTVMRVNQRLAEMFGYSAESLAGMRYETLVPDEEREIVKRRIAQLVESEHQALDIERRYRKADGATFWAMLSARRLFDPHGQVIGLVGVVLDLSERREAEQRLLLSEQRYRMLTESMKDVVWSADMSTMQITYCSPSIHDLCGYTPEQVCTGGMALLLGEVRAMRLQEILRERWGQFQAGHLLPGHAWLDELEHVTCQGKTVPTEVSSSMMPDPLSGQVILRGVTRDISERKQHEQAQRVAAVAFESHESMVVTDVQGVILQVNKAFSEMTGFSQEEVLGKKTNVLHSGRHDSEFYANMWRSIKESGFWQGEVWNRHKSGRVYPLWLTITAVRDVEGVTTHYVGSSFDITQQVQHQSEIRNLAFYDPLTGLANRRLFTDRLGHAFAKSGRSKLFGAVLYIDLDRFKEVNDTLGHAEGDRLLELVADRIATNVREGDTVSRFGGDEFVVLLEDVGEAREDAMDVVLTVAEKLRLALELPYRLHGAKTGEWLCSSSIGVAVFRGSQEDMESVLLRADRALYSAKERGRNAVCVGDGSEDSADA